MRRCPHPAAPCSLLPTPKWDWATAGLPSYSGAQELRGTQSGWEDSTELPSSWSARTRVQTIGKHCEQGLCA